MDPELLPDAKFFDEVTIFENIAARQVFQKGTAPSHHFHQGQFGAFVFALVFQVGADVVDALCEDGNLRFSAAGIGLAAAKFGEDLFLLCSV